MEIELAEIRDFIAEHSPFNVLSIEQLNEVTNNISIRYYRRGNEFSFLDKDQPYFFILRTGAIEFRNKENSLIDKFAEGDYSYQGCMSTSFEEERNGTLVEDTLVYILPCDFINKIKKQHNEFDRLLTQSINERLKHAVNTALDADMRDLSSMKLEVSSLTDRTPVIVDAGMTIQQAAKLMTDEKVSSILVVDNNQLLGMITDRDIRSRCVAENKDVSSPIKTIMTTNLETVTDTTLLSAALLSMTKKQINHLPILKDNMPIGMLTTTDIVRHLSANPALIATDIHKAHSIDALKKISAKLPELQIQLSLSSASAKHIGEVLSSITDAITIRLIELATDELGKAPVDYVWLAGGSQARNEQTSHTDQDNALLISNDYKPEDLAYFSSLAKFVCDGLNECGYVYCPGNAMAMNPEWCQPLKQWQSYFKNWISQPEPKALMLSSIFFDLRSVYGSQLLYEGLHESILAKTKNNELFISHMVTNALTHQPPLGFFRNFLMTHDEEHKKSLDMKRRGIVPIVDIARVIALENGINEVNTVERLHAGLLCKALSKEMHDNLLDALELISSLRIRHQAEQIRAGKHADNYLPIKDLSGLEKSHLKDAFSIIKTMQQFFVTRYPSA